jgi:phosphatidylserine synthase
MYLGENMKTKKIEKGTRYIIGISLLLLIAMYVLFVLGKSDATKYIAATVGVLMAIILFIEGSIIKYIRQKKYKKIGFGDVVVWLSAVASACLLVSSYFIVWGVRNGAPQWIANAVKPFSVSVAIFSAILVIVHLVHETFE